VVIAQPQTYMNDSGRAVLSLMTREGLTPQDILVVFDDADLPFGALRFRQKGGSGGHNGIRSIIESIGGDFNRLKIGIGRSESERGGLTSHVLGAFAKEEAESLEEIVKKAVAGIEEFVANGVLAAMEKYNPTPARPPKTDGPTE
jgi:PTH1 family peptidyl-tRNA hydrolase